MSGFDPQRDELLGKPCLSFQAQFSLPASARQALTEWSRQIQELVPGGLWTAPAESLHVTCYSLLSPRDALRDKELYWDRMSARAAQIFDRIAAEVPAFSLHFRTVRATDRAIIVLADNEASVTSTRAIFSGLVASHEARPVQLYDTIHTTICRYDDPTSIPPDLPRIVAALRPDIRAEIDRIMLIRETVYPSLRTETLLSAALAPPGQERC